MAALDRVRSALSAAGTSPCNIIVFGDSVSQGFGSNNPGAAFPIVDSRYSAKLARNLQAHYQAGVGGLGYVNGSELSNNSPAGSAYWTWSSGDSGTTDSRNFNGEIETIAANETVTLHWTGTSIKFQHQRGISGLGTLSVVTDGGSADTITPASTGGLDYQGSYTSALYSHGTHTSVVTPSSGKTPFICGAQIFDSDEGKGIRVFNHGRVGQVSGGVADMFSVAGLTDPLSATLCVNPALCIIFLGINDCVLGVSTATYQANITQIIANVKSMCSQNPSFLLLGPYDISSASGHPDIGPYNTALAAIAAADPSNVAFLDLRTIGTISMSDTVHANSTGHATIASALATFLIPPTQTLSLSGVSCTVTVGSSVAKKITRILPTGKAVTCSIGAPGVKSTAHITTGGVAGSAIFGTVSATSTNHLLPTGVTCVAADGFLALHPGPVSRSVTGIACGVLVGASFLRMGTRIIDTTGVSCTVGVGSPGFTLHYTLHVPGNPFSAHVGVPFVGKRVISATGASASLTVGDVTLKSTAYLNAFGVACLVRVGATKIEYVRKELPVSMVVQEKTHIRLRGPTFVPSTPI